MENLILYRKTKIIFNQNKTIIKPILIRTKILLVLVPILFVFFGVMFVLFLNYLKPINLLVTDYVFIISLSTTAYLFGVLLIKSNKKMWDIIYTFPTLYYGVSITLAIIVTTLFPIFFSLDFFGYYNQNVQNIFLILISYSGLIYLSLFIYVISWKRQIIIYHNELLYASYFDSYVIFPFKLNIKFSFKKEENQPAKIQIKGIENKKGHLSDLSHSADVYSYNELEFNELGTNIQRQYVVGLMYPQETNKLEAVSLFETKVKDEVNSFLEVLKGILEFEIVKVENREIYVSDTRIKSTKMKDPSNI